MNKKIILLFSLIMFSFILLPNVSAENMNGTCIGYSGGTYGVNTSENTTLQGYCLNSSGSSPSSSNANFTITNNTSSVQNNIKELIVKNYRKDNSSSILNLRYAIWHITDGYNVSSNSDAQAMLNSLENLTIGDSYRYIDGNYTHNFTFYLGHPTPEFYRTQSLILFDYIVSWIDSNITTPQQPGNNTPTPQQPGNNNTNPGNNTPTPQQPGNIINPENNTPTPQQPGNIINPENNTPTPQQPGNIINPGNKNEAKNDSIVDDSSEDPIVLGAEEDYETIEEDSSETPNIYEEKNTAKAANETIGMKETGMPIMLILLSMMIITGLVFKRKE